MNKSELRKKYLDIRKHIDNREEKCLKIRELVRCAAENCSDVFSYYAAGTEADITEAFMAFDGRVFCPVSQENSVMFFAECTSDTKKGMYGINEPCGEVCDITPDVVFVPGVAFDKSGGRIGYGKGYYDRYLSKISTVKIGVCFEEQLSDELFPCDGFDVKMDMIITQKGIYNCGKERA